MKKNITYKELICLEAHANHYAISNAFFKEGKWIDEQTKFSSSVKNILKQIEKLKVDYDEKLEDLRINNCLEDEKTKAILRDEQGNYKFSKESQKKLGVEHKELLKETCEIHIRITDAPSDLDVETYFTFDGILITPTEDVN